MTRVIVVCLERTNGSVYWGFGPCSRKKNHGVPEARQPKHMREAKLKNGGSGDQLVRGAEVLVAWWPGGRG